MMEACRNARKKYDAYLEEEKRKNIANAEETRIFFSRRADIFERKKIVVLC